MKCSICATTDFRPPEREFDLALRCDACDITFGFHCAGRETMDIDIVAFRCPNDRSHSVTDAPAAPDYFGMTVNERLIAAGSLDAYDIAARNRDLDSMVAILINVQLALTQARETSETVLADSAKYGY